MMKYIVKKMIAWLCVAALMVTCIGGSMVFAAEGDPINLAANKNAIATFEQHVNEDCWADNATDGDLATHWSTYGAVSGFSDANPQAIMIDLGAEATMTALNVYWFGDPLRTYTCNIYATNEPTIVVEDAVRGATGTFNKADLTPDDTYTSKTSSGSGTDPIGDALDEYTFAEPLVGRYITIEVTACVTGNNANLWDVQVMGTFNDVVDTDEIAGAAKPDAIDAVTGAEKADLGLPATVPVTLMNGELVNLPVEWSCEEYQADEPGEYVFVGTPDLTGTTYKNTNGVNTKMIVTLEDENVALGKNAIATFNQDNAELKADPKSVCDGDTTTRWSSYGSNKLPEYIMIDLNGNYKLSKLTGYWFNNYVFNFDIYVTDEPTITPNADGISGTFIGEDLTPVAKGVSMQGGGWRTHTFTHKPIGRYVTIKVNSRSGGGLAASLNEIGIYGVLTDEKPKPIVNLALNQPVVATGEDTEPQGTITDQGKKSYAVDGNKGTRWIANGLPDAIQVDLGQTCDLSSLGIYWFMNGRIVTFDVYVTDDPIVTDNKPFVKPTDVTPVLSDQKGENGSGSGSPGQTGTIREEYVLPEGTKGRYVTVYVTANDTRDNAILWELEVMGSYAETNPAAGLKIENSPATAVWADDAKNNLDITWNAKVPTEDIDLDAINSAVKFTDYGVIIGTSEDVVGSATVEEMTEGQTKKVSFRAADDTPDNITVYTVFGVHLTNVSKDSTVPARAAKFYISYTLNGELYTIYSDTTDITITEAIANADAQVA